VTPWLVDTGPVVAYLDPDDPMHERASAAFDSESRTLWTTMPVITEAMYLLRTSPAACANLVGFLRDCRANIEAFSSFEELDRVVALMAKYRDLPMDFADASVVALAERLEIYDVLTTDERGFRVFRTARNKWFHLVLDGFSG